MNATLNVAHQLDRQTRLSSAYEKIESLEGMLQECQSSINLLTVRLNTVECSPRKDEIVQIRQQIAQKENDMMILEAALDAINDIANCLQKAA